MNLRRTIKSLRGHDIKKVTLRTDEINTLKNNITEATESETVENVILNCLSIYRAKTTKEGFYINTIANLILTNVGDTLVLQEKFKKFLIAVLEDSILTVDPSDITKTKGFYTGWIVSQVLDELGAKLNDNGDVVYK